MTRPRLSPQLGCLLGLFAALLACGGTQTPSPPRCPEPTPAPALQSASATSSPSPPDAPALLVDGEIYSTWNLPPRHDGRPETEPPRLFVMLKREAVAEEYGGESERWAMRTWGAEYVVREATTPVATEEVTLVYPLATCVGRVRRRVLVEPAPLDSAPAARREALEVEGCVFSADLYTVPLAFGGAHPMARRTDTNSLSLRGASARRKLRQLTLEELGPRARETLRGLEVQTYYSGDGLEVITPWRPSPDVGSGEVHSNDADNGRTAYVRSGSTVLGIFPEFIGESMIELGDSRYLVLQLSMMNVSAYEVFAWSDGTLTPVLRICSERFPLGPECHRPFERSMGTGR